MNWDQAMGILRILLAAGGPVAVFWTRLGLSPDQANAFDDALVTLAGVAAPVAVGVWSWVVNRRKVRIVSVSQIPGTHVVVDATTAPKDVVAVAVDPLQPKVKLASEVHP